MKDRHPIPEPVGIELKFSQNQSRKAGKEAEIDLPRQ